MHDPVYMNAQMRLVNNEKLAALQKSPANVRNVCILAHVDHGKTTLADSLVASNGIISQKMAGKLRYMDSRQDEQERGITMKSSSIALYFCTKEEREFLINLIDSPGHVDFSSEVSTAVRLCDGAIIVVDVVEGVCPQTRLALKQVWVENIKPVLVLNKIDRLITEMKLSPLDAYVHLTQVLEQINAVMGELFATEVMSRDDVPKTEIPKTSSDEKTFDWSTGLEDEDDSNLYFAPEFENVVFASAIDGWGFRVKEFAKIFTVKLGINENLLKKVLWGDFYLNTKTKRVHKGAQEKAKKPLFVQLVLENLWTLYEAVVIRKDRDKMLNIVEKLDIKLTARDLRHTDSKVQLNAIMSQWLPLANSVLEMVSEKLPSPLEIKPERVEKLMSSQTRRFETLPKESQDLKENFLECSADDNAPVIVFISKLIPVERKSLPQFKPKPLTQEEIVQRKEQARLRHAQLQNELQSTGSIVPLEKTNETVSPKKEDDPQDVFIAFARIFSGTIRVGDDLFVLGPKHDPWAVVGKNIDVDPSLTLKDLRNNQHITKVRVESLYLLMGRDLESLQDVPAGNVCGIGGLEEHVLKTATLSTTIACPSFTELQIMAVPIVRVAVEPKQLVDMPDLRRGLRLLNQADACVQVLVQETGEHVLITAGEVHLERCLDDLKQRYAKIEINVSEPIVPFRETVVPPPTVDMTNEAIQEQTTVRSDDDADGSITISTPNKQVQLKLKAVPLPTEVTDLLENNAELLKSWNTYMRIARTGSKENAENTGDDTLRAAVESLERQVDEAFDSAGDEWKHAAASMWCVGPRQCGPNVLLNRIADYERVSMWTDFSGTGDPRSFYDSSLVNGFQLATLAGPLCEEPMMGVCFVVESWTLDETMSDSSAYGPLSGQILSAMKDGCRRAFQAKPQRLMAAMYSCNILVNAEVLGKMYAVLARRNGRVLSGDMMQGSGNFTVTAVLPVVESFSFAPEIRKQTSGLASPQLVFSHWEVIDIDPFWTPTTEEEYLHFGEKGDSFNRARRYMDNVRRRKGLAVEEKLVEFAEKQRTLSKNK